MGIVIMSDEKRTKRINTKKKFVADGVFNAELNAFLTRVLDKEGYAGIEIRATQSGVTEIRIKAADNEKLLEAGARRVREIKSLIEKRYGFSDDNNKLDITIRPPEMDRAFCAQYHVEQLKYKLLNGTAVRQGVNNIMGAVMRRGAVGVMVIVGGKVRGARAKAQKYTQGYLLSTGRPKRELVDTAVRHVNMRQGVLGLKVSIMAAVEKGKGKDLKVMPDYIKIHDPKDDNVQSIVPGVRFQGAARDDGANFPAGGRA